MSTHTYRIILVGFALLAGATAGAQTSSDYGTTSGTTSSASGSSNTGYGSDQSAGASNAGAINYGTSDSTTSGTTTGTANTGATSAGAGSGSKATDTASGATATGKATTPGTARPGTNGAAPAPETTAMAMPKSDAEIAAILEAANMAEIDAAKLAQSQGSNTEVKNFAKMMIDEHSKNDSQGDALLGRLKIKPSNNMASNDLKAQAKSKMTNLKSKSGADFDRAYLDSQVMMHQQVATDLQSRLIPAAKNSEFKSFLQETLSHVQSHLTEAQKLQSSIASGSSATTPGTGTGTGTMKK